MRHKWLSFTFIIEMFTASFILHIFCAFFSFLLPEYERTKTQRVRMEKKRRKKKRKTERLSSDIITKTRAHPKIKHVYTVHLWQMCALSVAIYIEQARINEMEEIVENWEKKLRRKENLYKYIEINSFALRKFILCVFSLLHVVMFREGPWWKRCEFWYLTVWDLSKHYANEHAKCKSIDFFFTLSRVTAAAKTGTEIRFKLKPFRMRGRWIKHANWLTFVFFYWIKVKHARHALHSHPHNTFARRW